MNINDFPFIHWKFTLKNYRKIKNTIKLYFFLLLIKCNKIYMYVYIFLTLTIMNCKKVSIIFKYTHILYIFLVITYNARNVCQSMLKILYIVELYVLVNILLLLFKTDYHDNCTVLCTIWTDIVLVIFSFVLKICTGLAISIYICTFCILIDGCLVSSYTIS